MGNKTLVSLFFVAAFTLTSAPTYAATIFYNIANIAANTWEYTYTVENDPASLFDIEEFTVFFDVGIYDNLASPTAPAGWDPLVIQPDPSVPDDGFYDALALLLPIGAGESLGGFSVQFDFLGTGIPGLQPFDIVDPLTFASLDSGTTLRAPTSVVSEPSSLFLFASAFVFFLGHKRRNQIL